MRRPTSRPAVASDGFTLLEIMIAMFVVAVLLTVAVPSYSRHVERVRRDVAIHDVMSLQLEIERFRLGNDRLPLTLVEAGFDDLRDPWGHAYEYLNFDSGVPGIKGKRRKDRNLVPINSEYDLYSCGKDGESRAPLTAKASRDDIVRAHDGNFIGLAVEF